MSLGEISCSALCSIIDSLELGIAVIDEQQRVTHWNRWLAERSGMSDDAVRGRAVIELFPEARGGRLEQAIGDALRHRMPSLLSPALHGTLLPLFQNTEDKASGRRMQQLIHVIPLRTPPQQRGCLIQISDMTANISRERLLRQQAENLRRTTSEDSLTGVPNRKRFEELLATEFRKAQYRQSQLAVAIVDIDLFNDYNEHYGRPLGDNALAELGKLFRGSIRPVGDVVARYGGDEFAFILPGLKPEEACQFAENLRLLVAARGIPNEASRVSKALTISVGAAVMTPDAESDTHTLLSSADVALYQAKHEGRNRTIYFSIDDGSFKNCS